MICEAMLQLVLQRWRFGDCGCREQISRTGSAVIDGEGVVDLAVLRSTPAPGICRPGTPTLPAPA
jgi:hypothetical protein